MFKSYLKIALRNLLRQKGTSFINITGLAIGMTCCILILLWVRHELSYDRFHEKSHRIYRVVKLEASDATEGIVRAGAPWGPALKQEFPEVENFVRFRHYGRTLVRAGETRLFEDNGLFTDSTFFDVFSFDLLKGDVSSALVEPNSVVLTQELANKLFGQRDPIGETVLFDDVSRRVTGVVQDVPDNAHFDFGFLAPLSSYTMWDLDRWEVNNFYVYVLLGEDADPGELEAKMPGFMQRHLSQEEAEKSLVGFQPLTDIHLHSNYEREFQANGDITYVYLFSVIAVFIVLIACINFMNLSTAKSSKRAREIGIRKVVGSVRQQLVRQFLSETVLISVLALTISLGLVEVLLPRFANLTGARLTLDLFSNPLLAIGLLGFALIVGFLAGAYPAFYLSGFRPIAVLRGESQVGAGRSWLRKILVVTQFTVSVGLIFSTIVVLRQLGFISNKKLGFEPSQILVVRMSDSAALAKIDAFKQTLLNDSDITASSATSNLLGGSDWGMPFRVMTESGEETVGARVLIVDQDFVETMKMEIAEGRNFSDKFASDVKEAVLINETAARELGWKHPLGKELKRIAGEDENGETIWQHSRVVGVVKDFNFRSLHQEIQPMVLFMMPDWYRYLTVRIKSTDLRATLAEVEKTWREFEPERPFDYFFLDQSFEQLYRSEQRLGETFKVFSALAILIACLGLFGLAAYSAEQRTKEVGIRKVLGASVTGLVGLLSKEFVQLVIVANLVAWPLAYFAMGRWLQSFAYRIEIGWWIFGLAGGLALVIALLTVSMQAVKAALANPVDSLRYE